MSDIRPSAPPSLRSRIRPAADNDQDPIDLRPTTAPSPAAVVVEAPTAPASPTVTPATIQPPEYAQAAAVPRSDTQSSQISPESLPSSEISNAATPIVPPTAPAAPGATAPPAPTPRYAKSRRQEVTVQMSSRVGLDIRDMADEIVAFEGGTLRSVLERAVRDLHAATVGRQQ